MEIALKDLARFISDNPPEEGGNGGLGEDIRPKRLSYADYMDKQRFRSTYQLMNGSVQESVAKKARQTDGGDVATSTSSDKTLLALSNVISTNRQDAVMSWIKKNKSSDKVRVFLDGVRSLKWLAREYDGVKSDYSDHFIGSTQRPHRPKRAYLNFSSLPIGSIYSRISSVYPISKKEQEELMASSYFKDSGDVESLTASLKQADVNRKLPSVSVGGVNAARPGAEVSKCLKGHKPHWKSEYKAQMHSDVHNSLAMKRFDLVPGTRAPRVRRAFDLSVL